MELQVVVMEDVGDDWEGNEGFGSDPELYIHDDTEEGEARALPIPTTWSPGSS